MMVKLVFWVLGISGENPSQQSENQQETQPSYGTRLESNPGHIGGM